ncbi:hypothetical protein MINTM005_24230 [Mycobacterium intracellulare]|nr:hypothetical protein MINTM005_24230 [Mycobacterium intracellulare]BCO94283.1 hypothetical protein MINTM016_22590 [Mycobacterium intracellulare]
MSPPGAARRPRHIKGWQLTHPGLTKAAEAANDVFLRILFVVSPRLAMRLMDRQFQRDAALIAEMLADFEAAGYVGAA